MPGMSSYEAGEEVRSGRLGDILFGALIGLTFIGLGTWLGLSVYSRRTVLLMAAVGTVGVLLASVWRLKLLRKKARSLD